MTPGDWLLEQYDAGGFGQRRGVNTVRPVFSVLDDHESCLCLPWDDGYVRWKGYTMHSANSTTVSLY